MFVTFDQLSTALIVGTIALLIGVMQVRTQRSSVERSAMYVAKKGTLEFADYISRDLSNFGKDMPDAQRLGAFSANKAGMTDSLQFWRINTKGDTLNIIYTLVPADTVVYQDTTTTIYQVNRFENGLLAGGSMPTLRSFKIDFLSDSGASVGSNIDQAQQIQIRLSNMLPFARNPRFYLEETFWGTTLRPHSLQ